jgi:BirA family transcriptional regulator, biotin operon repressor / biotin---[acetyl-CoA-carboxylase] ligase
MEPDAPAGRISSPSPSRPVPASWDTGTATPHVIHDVLPSTNLEALTRARAGEPGPLWITAREQTAGRGRLGRDWASPSGNLYATLLVRDPAPVACAPQLALVAGLAVCDAILSFAGCEVPVSLKWPNDVLLRGAKVAGVLIEGEGTPVAVAVGIGVNCISHPDHASYPATDLRAEGMQVSPDDLFTALSSSMARRLAQWQRGTNFASVRVDWLNRAHPAGTELCVRLATGEFSGRFETLDDFGRLQLRRPDGTVEVVGTGDVVSVRWPAIGAPAR